MAFRSLSVLAGNRIRASAAATGRWFFFVLIFNLLLIGNLTSLETAFGIMSA